MLHLLLYSSGMSAVLLLTGLASVLFLIGAGLLVWGVGAGQWDDLDTPAQRVLGDDPPAPPALAALPAAEPATTP